MPFGEFLLLVALLAAFVEIHLLSDLQEVLYRVLLACGAADPEETWTYVQVLVKVLLKDWCL